ncbi:MAG TPA: DEAD/DEAH box helicase [Burkholderiales bacterium]
MTFDELGLSAEILRAVADEGYSDPTPIQVQAIPVILKGSDVMAQAQTGTGKTAGFTLPLLMKLQPGASTSLSPARHPLKALILTPTRELAQQVFDSVRTYGKHLPLRAAVVYGGVDMDPQIKDLHGGVEILVATPGRLLDHSQNRTVNLSKVEVLILDEADRMLDMGFMPDLKRIISLLPPVRQNLMFSATFSEDIRRLAGQILRDPVRIEVARKNAPAELVSHLVHRVARDRKRSALARIVREKDLRQVLVFVATKQGAGRLARELVREGIEANAIHGDKTQPERQKALNEFKEGKVRVLVGTDVAARGLDIEDLPHVINYELPNSPEDYVHRIGRTGRAGKSGDAISLVSDDEMDRLRDIEKLLRLKIPVEELPGVDAPEPRRERAPVSPRERVADPKRERSREPRPERARPARETERGRPAPAGKGPRATDPIFSQPYEPSGPPETDEAPLPGEQAAAPHARRHFMHGRRVREVPALLTLPVRKKEG